MLKDRTTLEVRRSSAFALLLLSLISCTSTAQILDVNGGCQLVGLLPFTDEREGPPEVIADEDTEYYGYGSWPDAATLGKATYSLMAAAEIAVQHFNNRDTTIVPELGELGSCDITFPDVFYHDSAYVRKRAVDAIFNRTRAGILEGMDPSRMLCGVIGPTVGQSSEGVSAISENLGIPQMAYSAIDMRLSSRESFPTLARVIPSSYDYATAVTIFMQRDAMKRDYLGIIFDTSRYGRQFEDPLEEAVEFLADFFTTEEPASEDEGEEAYEEALEEIAEIGVRTFLLAAERFEVLEIVATIADEMDLIGDDYVWFLTSDMISKVRQESMRYEVDSPMDRMLRGAAVFSNLDPFIYHGESDPFLKVWRQQGTDLLKRLEKLHPLPTDHEAYYKGSEDYFKVETPTAYASYLYDGIIATGIGACRAQAAIKEQRNRRRDEEEDFEEPTAHVSEIFKAEFQGASGHVRFKKDLEILEGRAESEQSNSRDVEGVQFGMYNIRPRDDIDEDGKRGYDLVLTHLYHGDEVIMDPKEGFEDVILAGVWKPVEGEEFIYYDGTADEPKPVRTTAEWNFLSKQVQSIGFGLMSLGLLVSIGSGLWVFLLRNEQMVQASQPIFLYMMCLGAAMVSFSLFCLSFDEGKGWSEEGLSFLCGLFPWLCVIGYMLIYCALFSKLFRINLYMEQNAVHMKQVMLPFGILMFGSIFMLIVWTAVEPLQWVRSDISEDELGELVTIGECESEGGDLPFVLPLAAMIAFTVGITAAVSWSVRDVEDGLAESKWIFFGIVSHIQFWLTGIPLYYILNELNKDASYLTASALTFVFSTSMVASVIWPKIYVWARDKYFGGPAREEITISLQRHRRSSTRVSGIVASDSSLKYYSGQSFRASGQFMKNSTSGRSTGSGSNSVSFRAESSKFTVEERGPSTEMRSSSTEGLSGVHSERQSSVERLSIEKESSQPNDDVVNE